MTSAPEGFSKHYYSRSRLVFQPQEGPRYQVQDKKCRLSERHVDQRSQIRKHMVQDEP